LELAESDAATVVRRTVDDASGLSTAHQVTADAPPRVPVIWDEVRIEQVLANLLGNAIKHTPGGEIRIILEFTADDRIRIEVRDSGPGIPEALLATLFDRYVRGRPGANGGQTEASGLGLGLYISRLIARAHGGDLSVANVEHGGARFLLTLPRAARPPRAGLEPAAVPVA
ncbi:MAG: ATP-binding protein, partial [Chloroflexia bacterium]|nr:ATP-binding protein [Chloroflexia bacterium]